MNKRGQGLSFNTIVVIILALLVLVVMAVIFTGSSATVVQRLQEIFTGGPTNDSLAVVEAQCRSLCSLAQSTTNQEFTKYCTNTYDIEGFGSGVGCSDLIQCSGVAC